METPENTENDPDNPEPADGDIKIEYSSDSYTSQVQVQ
jgi:hypothetical protein